jgi:hypothetical protein
MSIKFFTFAKHLSLDNAVMQILVPKLCTQFDLSGCAVSFGCHDLFLISA